MNVNDSPRWYLYVIECRNGRLYTGITTDLAARFRKHCLGKGAMFTRLNPPRRMLAAKPYPDRSAASKAEWQFKQLRLEDKQRQAASWPLIDNLPSLAALKGVQ